MISLFAFLKMMADTGLWLAGASVVISLFYPAADMTLPCLLLGLGGGIAHFLSVKNRKLRYFGVIPGLFAFLFCKSTGDMLTLLPALFYLILSTAKTLLQPDQTQMYYRFRGRAMVCLGVSLLCVLRRLGWGFSLCMYSLTAWVFLMRMLRHDLSDLSDRKLVGLELALMGAVCILILLLSRNAVLTACIWTIKKVYFIILQPILKLIIGTALLVVRFFDWVLGQFFTGKFEMDINNMVGQSFEAVEDIMPSGQGSTGGTGYVLLLLKAVGILLFLGVGFLVFRQLLSGAAKAVAARESEDSRKGLPETTLSSDAPSVLDRSPEARVRRSYAAYCRAVDKYRKKLRPADTTRDVNRLARLESNPDAEALRQLYFRARYTRGVPLNTGDARKAANLSKTLRADLQKNTIQEEKI